MRIIDREIDVVQSVYMHKFTEVELEMIEQLAYSTALEMMIRLYKSNNHEAFKALWHKDDQHNIRAILEAGASNIEFKGLGKKKVRDD